MPNPSADAARIEVALGVVVENMSVTPGSPPLEPGQTPRHATTPPPRVLITRRRPEQVLGGYWELPGGKVEPDETPEHAVVRELHEELAIAVAPVHALPSVEHDYDHASVRLLPYICKHTAGDPTPIAADEARWVAPDDLHQYTFPDATLPILDALKRWLKQADPAAPNPA